MVVVVILNCFGRRLFVGVSGAYKYPKLSELCSHFGIENAHISNALLQVFGANADFHDARFDTTACLLAVNKGFRESSREFQKKRCTYHLY